MEDVYMTPVRTGALKRTVTIRPEFRNVKVRRSKSLLAKEAANATRSVSELKDVNTTAIAIPALATATGSLTLLNGMVQGTTGSTRIGRRIRMESLLLRIALGAAVATTGCSPFRILIVFDKQSNGAAPLATDILTQDNITGAMNLANSRRFVTILDHIEKDFGPQSSGSIFINRYKKFKLDVEFNGGVAGTIADINTGSVYALTYLLSGTLATAPPVASTLCRIRFADS